MLTIFENFQQAISFESTRSMEYTDEATVKKSTKKLAKQLLNSEESRLKFKKTKEGQYVYTK